MIVLALSTSTARGGVAVMGGGRVLGASAYTDLAAHAERIFATLDAALAEAGLPRASVEAIACDLGPGSFTGVRVGVASAKGIAMALGVPLVGVTSLDAMAAAAFGEGAAGGGEVVVPVLDAKKDELFVAAYAASASLARRDELASPRHLPRSRIAEALAGLPAGRPIVVAGEVGAALAPFADRWPRSAAFDLPDAAWIARIAVARLEMGDGGDPAAIEPLYVRAPDATLPGPPVRLP